MKSKVWRIKNRSGSFSDDEIINMLKNKTLSLEDELICKQFKDYIKIKDSIYRFYYEEAKNETI